MKNLTTVIALIAITLFGCNKQAKVNFAPQKMTAAELKVRYGIEIPSVDYGNGVARNNKPKAATLTVTVWSSDLTLTESGGVLTTTLSPDAEWGGVQKFFTIDTTNNGVSVCNWNWSGVTTPATQTCNSNGTGSYRSWTSDKVTYDVHTSSFLPL